MLRSFLGAVIGAGIGLVAGAAASNTIARPDWPAKYGLFVLIGTSAGSIVGAVIGSTGAMIDAIKKVTSSR
jgi:hypothetical protein